MSYIELSIEERASLQLGQAQGMSLRRIVRLLRRAPSTIFREMLRNQMAQDSFVPGMLNNNSGDARNVS